MSKADKMLLFWTWICCAIGALIGAGVQANGPVGYLIGGASVLIGQAIGVTRIQKLGL